MARPSGRGSKSAQLLRVDGIHAPVELRTHPTARRLTLRVSRTRRAVFLTVPRNYDPREANRFLTRNLDWVLERLDGVPAAVPFEHGAVIPVRGVAHEIQFIGPQPRRPIVTLEAGAGRLPTLSVTGEPAHAPRRLLDWLTTEARRELDHRVTFHATTLGLRARRITLRDQKSRWGSCSSGGCLSFSWRLVLAPSFVLDYVAAHEVAHLAEMNHGPRFWKLVAKVCPGMEEAKFWLRRNGMDLHRYGCEN